jgi:hypothetical protein
MPLRLSWDRAIVYGSLLAGVTSLPFILFFPTWFRDVAFRGDFANFWSAGANAGSSALMDPGALAAWQVAHHVKPQLFVYPPGVAWLYAPLAHLPPVPAMAIEDCLMVAALVICGLLAARVYQFSLWFGPIAAFAWGPAINAIEVGQNTPFALLAILAAIWALVNRRPALAGLAIGVLLYKPSAALALVVLLLARREWRALMVCALVGLGWYVLGVLATNGSVDWPARYVHLVAQSSIGEFAGNSYKTYTVPTLLLSAGASGALAAVAALAVFAGTIPLLIRRPLLEAASMASVLGIATSLHAWPYEATLLLPAVFFAMANATEPWRTRVIVASYVVAALALSLPHAGHALALLAIGGLMWWLWCGYRPAVRDAVPARPV